MHYVNESAEGSRARRRTETARTLIRLARAATAAHGLHGFTVEELCEQAGLSRRTFFNYFASKEDAVLGIPLHRGDEELTAAFVAGGTASGDISPTLLDDLAELALERWRTMDIAPDTARELFAAMHREPRLLGRMLDLGAQGEQDDARLIVQREGLEPGDLRAQVAALTVGALARAATGEYLHAEGAESFDVVFARHMRAARDLFATQAASLLEGHA
ncbi:MAG: helix-turn-helix domain-containing protein [Microbacterium sp.]|uniref:TetR/AcrR family transcriptional regulator n=1 Tax=Microbacterium sp. TaxID=51671 RepID=UPI0039E549AC